MKDSKTLTEGGVPEEPPPSYEEATEEPLPSGPVTYNGGFPTTFNMYGKMSWTTQLLHIGEQKDRPLYAVSLHTGFSGKPAMILHKTLDPKSPTLASATRTKKWTGLDSSVVLAASDQWEESTTIMHMKGKGMSMSFDFEVEVPTDLKPRIERFEWRSSHGSEVKDLMKHGWGWKLVRLDSDTSGGGERSARPSGETSDGKEVVAVWADNTKMSWTKMGSFQFLGSGATGQLGSRWILLAVVTGLRVWQINYDLSTGQGTSGASASSSGAAAASG